MKRFHTTHAAMLGIAMILAGCPHPQVPLNTVQTQSLPVLRGKVELSSSRTAQATMGEIANGATVSLIDPVTGYTLANTIAASDGTFTLSNFSNGFRPAPNTAYFLEAIKGLKAGGTPNRAGASVARVRSLVSFQNNLWNSLTGNAITLSRSTTALSVIASLRAGVVAPSSLLGTVTSGAAETVNWTRTPQAPAGYSASTPDSFNSTGTNIDPQDYHLVFGLVDAAINTDQDPLFSVSYDPVSALFVRDTNVFTATSIVPATGSMGSTASIYGHNFDPNPYGTQVTFNGAKATVNSVSSDRTQLVVTIPYGYAGSGSVVVTNANVSYTLPNAFGISVPPGATYQYYAFNGGTSDGGYNSPSYLRLIATQANTTVTVTPLSTNGAAGTSNTNLIASPGQAWEYQLPADSLMYKITANLPIFASYDNITAHGSDDDIASLAGTDYYFRQPAQGFNSTDEYAFISATANNNVTVTCLQNPAYSWSGVLGTGGVYRNSVATTSFATNPGGSYIFHVTSTSPTVATYGYSNDNNATQVPSINGDGKLFYTANRANGSAAGYYLVGYQNGTNVNITGLPSNTSTTTLNAGTYQFIGVPAGAVNYSFSANNPMGVYFTDASSGYDGTQHYSIDNPSGTGRNYSIVAPSKATSSVYIVSSSSGNSVTLSGATTGTYALGKDAWFNAGGLPNNAVLNINATYPVGVVTFSGSTSEINYTMLPIWPAN